MPSLNAAFILLIFLIPAATAATRPPSVEDVLRTYEGFNTYCDEVEVRGSDAGKHRRCLTADGRYRIVERVFWTGPHTVERWGDGTRHFRWEHRDGETNQYSERATEYERKRADAILGVFLDTVSSSFELRQNYRLAGIESGRWLFEKKYEGAVVGRLWVRQSDGVVVRSMQLWKAQIVREALLKSVRLNEELAPTDLTSPVPLLTRYSLMEKPVIFVAALALVSFILGAVARVLKHDFPVKWKTFLKIAVSLVAGCGGLTLLCLIGKDSGHPPAIVFALMLDALVGLLLVFATSFLLAVTLVNRFFGNKRQS